MLLYLMKMIPFVLELRVKSCIERHPGFPNLSAQGLTILSQAVVLEQKKI